MRNGGGSRARGTVARGGWTNNRLGVRGGRSNHALDPLLSLPKGELLGQITSSDAQSSDQFDDVDPVIKDCQYMASYNWLNTQEAKILVPGAPPVWNPPKERPRLSQDEGEFFRDPNAARFPRFPAEPGIRAVLALHPDFEGDPIDVVGCGSTMGNLLRFAGSKDWSFRFYVEQIGRTVFLVRREKSPTELIEGVWGYGHTFPEAYTTWDATVKGSVSHQRLIKYDFGGMKCLVRSESDGYLKEKVLPGSDTPMIAPSSTKQPADEDLSALLQAAQSIAVSEHAANQNAPLTMEMTGSEVPQNAVFDLKTRSARKEFDMEEVYPRLWVNQTPNFIIAYHVAGNFKSIQVQDVRANIKDWEKSNKERLRRFGVTLRLLIKAVKESENNKIEIRRIGLGPLQIRKPIEQTWSTLPPDLEERWLRNPASSRLKVQGSSSATKEGEGEEVDSGHDSDGLDNQFEV
ncbi:MAG: hypothetical protein M1833_006965 [Piccolia ochrophora]|nr:MAG: hypothetical protein M1833_006965 [Piccolia ochrophora]